jgi:hypothetical protein
MLMSLPDSVSTHSSCVVNRCPGIAEIWLVGSRANLTQRDDSDWDFLLFADEDTLSALRAAPELARDDFDLLVVIDGDRFESPWQRMDTPGKFKRGRLANYLGPDGIEVVTWEWSRISEAEAEYIGEELKPQRALRIYERTASA